MDEAFASGAIVYAVLAAMLLELLVLLWLRARGGRGPSAVELLTGLAAGAALLFALRAALLRSAWPHIALWLIVALVAHVADMMLRWKSARS